MVIRLILSYHHLIILGSNYLIICKYWLLHYNQQIVDQFLSLFS